MKIYLHLHATANSLAVPALPPEHHPRRTGVRADVLGSSTDAFSAARVDCTDHFVSTIGAGGASWVAARGASVDANTRAFRGSSADAAVVGATADELPAAGSGTFLSVRHDWSLALTSAAGLAIAAGVAAGAAVASVGLEVLAGVWGGAAESRSGARAWADGLSGSGIQCDGHRRRFGESGFGDGGELGLCQRRSCSEQHGLGHKGSFSEGCSRSDVLRCWGEAKAAASC